MVTFFFVVDEGKRIQISNKWAIFGPLAKRHLNGVSLAGRWLPNIECWFGSFVNLQGIRPVLLRNPIFL